MKTFELNKDYYSTFIGDADLRIGYRVVKRTAKFVTFENLITHEVMRLKLLQYFLDKGEEVCGKYGEFIHSSNAY